MSSGESLTAGVMEVRGNVISTCFIEYRAEGSHKLVLSGEKEQEVSFDGIIVLNELEVKNEIGVSFSRGIEIRQLKGNYKIIGELTIYGETVLTGDVSIDGDLRVKTRLLDLGGKTLEVAGNLTQEVVSDNRIKINGGKLLVNGNYTIGNDQLLNTETPIIEMTNEEDYVFIGGNFATSSTADHSEYLTSGTFELKGNFTQSNSPLNFTASGTHKTILSGDTVQTITFESPTASSFNILKLTKPLDTGYIFNTTPVWRTLED